uniref:Uncharacterized protein n=1 Tax=Mycena chlorophos TaxID=658473 RepID=A0ABQ0LQR9_MYCCL|nr:predicted protein [Mycena chlorophos]
MAQSLRNLFSVSQPHSTGLHSGSSTFRTGAYPATATRAAFAFASAVLPQRELAGEGALQAEFVHHASCTYKHKRTATNKSTSRHLVPFHFAGSATPSYSSPASASSQTPAPPTRAPPSHASAHRTSSFGADGVPRAL